MTAEIFKIRDYQSKPLSERLARQRQLVAEAIEIMNVVKVDDTTPCEYTAPTDDPA